MWDGSDGMKWEDDLHVCQHETLAPVVPLIPTPTSTPSFLCFYLLCGDEAVLHAGNCFSCTFTDS